jgi:CheY-like chemotaxis protein
MSAPAGHRDGWRIIATDDNTTKLSTIVQTLRDAGHCLFGAYDGQSALELITLLPDIDLLITNTRLGAVDGLELMRRTRELRPDMPILHVVHSGEPPNPVPHDVLTVQEPLTPNQLLLVVGSLLA